jgi:glycosyltransferase involved in cell wall biosynthesis
MTKVAFLTNIPASYRTDFFNQLASHYQQNITFHFIPDKSSSHKGILHSHQSEPFIQRSQFYDPDKPFRTILRLIKNIHRQKPDIIIESGFPARLLSTLLHSKLIRSKIYTWLGETPHSALQRSPLQRLWRQLSAPHLNGSILYSEHVRPYILNLNPKLKEIFVLGNNTRDSLAYGKRIDATRKSSKNGRIIFLSVGFQIPRKNTSTLIQAFSRLEPKYPNAQLQIVGDGEELQPLKEQCHQLRLNNVQFLGAKQPEEMYEIYGNADIFVHPA